MCVHNYVCMCVGVYGMHVCVNPAPPLSTPVLSGWETANKYQIKNSLGQQVYFAAEGK